MAQKTDLIAPGEANYQKIRHLPFETDAAITDFRVHMHYRGKSALLKLTTPEGEVLEGLAVPRYDFNWQRVYYLREPMLVPKGTVATMELTWDNSASNPSNPDPTVPVKFGQLTTNEMGSGTIGYTVPGVTIDPPIVVKNGRRID